MKAKLISILSLILVMATPLFAQFWFETISNDTLLPDTTTQVYSYTTERRLKEITFTYDHADAELGVDLDSSKIILLFNTIPCTLALEDVFNCYAAGTESAEGIWTVFDYDTGIGTIDAKLSNLDFVLDSLKISMFNASTDTATFKGSVIWESLYYRKDLSR